MGVDGTVMESTLPTFNLTSSLAPTLFPHSKTCWLKQITPEPTKHEQVAFDCAAVKSAAKPAGPFSGKARPSTVLGCCRAIATGQPVPRAGVISQQHACWRKRRVASCTWKGAVRLGTQMCALHTLSAHKVATL